MAAAPTGFDRTAGIASDMTQLVGNTPMVMLSAKTNKTAARIALKLESENPMASVKDRLALSIIVNAEKDGKIKPGVTTLVEATSGNTGIALAQLAAVKGYACILVMPESMSQERRCLLQVFGTRVYLTPAANGMKGAIAYANKIAATVPNSYITGQFETEYNARIHYETTGPEIWKQTNGEVDVFVSGVGTGGTLTGTGRFLKERKSSVRVAAVEPDESPVLSGGSPAPHKIQGIGAGFIPAVMDKTVMDEVVRVSSDEALTAARALPQSEGLFVGISSGAAVAAALKIGARPESAGKLIVVIIPSFGERYLSTVMFQGLREEVAKWPVVPADEIFPPQPKV